MTEWLLVEASSDSLESSARDRNGAQPIEGDAEKGTIRAESDTQCPQIHLYASYQGFGFVRNRIRNFELQQLKS